jgi:hypothetical protein
MNALWLAYKIFTASLITVCDVVAALMFIFIQDAEMFIGY